MVINKANLLRVMNLPQPPFTGVIRKADGYYIARQGFDVGYNVFLGRPANEGPGKENTLRVWNSLTSEERAEVRLLAANPVDGTPIPLEDFGVPTDVELA